MGDFFSIGCPSSKSLRLAQVKAAVGLSLLFMAVYGGVNFLTSLRSDVGTLVFAGEKYIPFIPLMIIPYMSIDLFFIAAPFLCGDLPELKVFCKRISLAIVIGGVCFLLLPLKFAFVRPVPDGIFAPVFKLLQGFDDPYNMCPSLHIALRTILAHLYVKKFSGKGKIALHVWFSLIGFSTLFTYQHHVIDVVGGFVLALLVFYFIPGEDKKVFKKGNKKVGLYYLLGSLVFLGLVFLLWPWGIIFFWPLIAMFILALGYLGLVSEVYRKRAGKLSFPTKVIFLPILMGQYVSLLYYKQQCRDYDKVLENVWIGRKLSDKEALILVDKGVTSVLDLTSEFSEAEGFLKLDYFNLDLLDLTAPTIKALDEAADFIWEKGKRGIVYVHCKIGYSRSAAVIGAYLLKSGKAVTVSEAVGLISKQRPSLIVRPEVRDVLEEYNVFLKSGQSPAGKFTAEAKSFMFCSSSLIRFFLSPAHDIFSPMNMSQKKGTNTQSPLGKALPKPCKKTGIKGTSGHCSER